MTELKFEDALNKLEKIVSNMESGELTLEDSLKKYEEGMKLSRFCTKKLKEAEKKIEVLIKDKDGDFKTEDFELSQNETGPEEIKHPSPPKSRPEKKSVEEEDEDLLF